MWQVIVNEASGHGDGARTARRVEALLQERGIAYRLLRTGGAGDGARLVDEAFSAGERAFVCVGGDGLIHEAVNGLAGRDATLLFAPCGTGNDFVRMLRLPRDPVDALRAQLSGRPHRIDVGRINDQYFLNVSGSGFDAEVLRQADRFKLLGRGLLPYLLGALAALRHFRPLHVEMTLADGRPQRREVTIFAVGNGRYYGGGMKAVPDAVLDDGQFDVLVADRIGRLRILGLLGKFIRGRHTDLPIIHQWRCRQVAFRCPGMIVNIDGELEILDEARYEILPGALEIRLPG